MYLCDECGKPRMGRRAFVLSLPLSSRDRRGQRIEEFVAILESLFQMPALPHHIITFGLHDLKAWQPAEIAADYIWEATLRQLHDIIKATTIEVAGRKVLLSVYIPPLTKRLGRQLNELIKHGKQREMYADLLKRRGEAYARDLRLLDFEPGSGERRTDAVRKWAWNILTQRNHREKNILDCMREVLRDLL